jgi:beta-glucosidase
MLHGHKGLYIGNIDGKSSTPFSRIAQSVTGNERLGIPAIHMHDGPQGFRVTGTTAPTGSTTAWPSGLSVAASWDVNLMEKWHAAMATEFKGKGANIFLGPGIGIARVPNAGRNFEYLCGEDPYLGSILVIPAVNGIQDQGIMANAKHYVNNEIEDQRMLVSAEVDERTRYVPPAFSWLIYFQIRIILPSL